MDSSTMLAEAEEATYHLFCNLRKVTATATNHAGGLPAAGSLLQLDTAGAVALGALKAAGNPLACGSAQAVDPAAAGCAARPQTVGEPR